MQRRANSRSSRTAVERVSQVWSTCAVHTRGELRAYGIRGELRRLDDYAAGELTQTTRRLTWIVDVIETMRRGAQTRQGVATDVAINSPTYAADVERALRACGCVRIVDSNVAADDSEGGQID